MNDALKAARRRGALRRLIWPRGRKHKGFMHGRRWMGAALVLLVLALTAAGVAALSGGKAQPDIEVKRSEGVLSLYDFFRQYAKGRELAPNGPLRSLTERLLEQPFEISARVTVRSEALGALGIPLAGVPVEARVKYDLQELGVKASALGLELLGAVLSGDELTAVWMNGEQASVQLGAGGGVSGDMTLKSRAEAFVPPLPDERFFDMLAQCVPGQSTELRLGRVYSPKDETDVNVTLVDTTLQGEALRSAAASCAQRLKQDDALDEQARRFVSAAAFALGADGMTPGALLAQLAAADDDTAVSWQVFRRDGTPIGFAVRATADGIDYVLTRIAELDAGTVYERVSLSADGVEVFLADSVAADGEGRLGARMLGADGNTVGIEAEFLATKLTDNSYRLTAAAAVTGVAIGGTQSDAAVDVDARIDVGNGLGLLRDSDGWRALVGTEG